MGEIKKTIIELFHVKDTELGREKEMGSIYIYKYIGHLSLLGSGLH